MIKKMLKCSWLIIALCAAITVFFGWQLRTIKIENTSRTFMPKDDDSYKLMLKTEDTFGSMLMLGISLETKGATILTPEYINVVKKITDRIESVNYVENIDSISNIDFIHGEISEDGEGTLKASSLLGDDDAYSFTADGMKTIKQEIIDWQEMYNRVIVNDDFKATQMMVTITASTEDGEELPSDIQNKILAEIKGICEEELDGSDLEVRYFGDPVMSHDAREFLMSDLINLIPFVALIVLFSLYFSFHTWSGTLLPLITVLISTVWSVGLLCLLDFSFTIIGSMIPVCLIACGSAYGIHVMTHYYIGLDKIEGEITKENHAGAIEFALKDVWIAVLLAAVTTVAGFISNVSSPLRPLRSFSIFAASGVAFALILSITLIPALLYVTPVKVVGKHWKNNNRLSTKIRRRLEHELARRGGKSKDEANASTLYSIYHFFAGTKPRLVILVLVILFLSSIGLKLLVVDTAMVNYFPRTSKFRQDLAYVDETLSGSNSMYIVIKGKEIENSAQSEEEALDLGEFDFSEFEEPALGTELESVTESSSDSDFGDFDFSSFDEPASSSENTADAEPVKQYYSLTDPEILRAVDDLQNYLAAKHPEIGKVVSFTTFIKRMNQVMHVPVAGTSGVESESADILDSPAKVKDILEMMNRAYAAAGGEKASTNAVVRELERELNYNGLAYYEIPYDIEKYSVDRRENLSNLVTQYLYLLSSDAITRFADDMTNPKAIRTQVQLRTHSTVDTGLLINDINDYVAKYFPTDKYTVETTGSAALENTMSHLVIDSQMVSIVFSLVMVFIIIALSFKSGWAGLIGAIPLGLVILLNFMVMGFMGIRLDLCTSIVSSIAIGVGIDYTIHFMETYQHEREKSNDSESVTKATFKSSGKGIVTNAIAVGLGFLVLVFSKFIILRYIGILVAVVMFTSSMLAMTVIPGLLNAFDPKFMWSKDEKEAYKAKIEAEKK
ncbi:MMPL family transporter [Treponema sp. UBA3813]|uniref:efflux RND transporter permease subunit n=1 Tax=Treponema sp. UBA3813 TaxID=1947715 RepID=UPI0025FBA81E|nr:MMPL family transporter [Treponema sp. UBA3813]